MVSIHAPTRGATLQSVCFLHGQQVSIHAPTRGATNRLTCVPVYDKFQSTHPHGVRPSYPSGTVVALSVSIHAPTRGATTRESTTMYLFLCFNPRTHTGCDAFFMSLVLSVLRFQSTHPHGVRHTRVYYDVLISQFQSTHPHGVRLAKAAVFKGAVRVSIHAPTRGATVYSANV